MPPAAKKTDPKTPAKANTAGVFEANPKADKVFVTSDEQVFLREDFAKSHAKFLDDKAITTVERDADATEADNAPAE